MRRLGVAEEPGLDVLLGRLDALARKVAQEEAEAKAQVEMLVSRLSWGFPKTAEAGFRTCLEGFLQT